MGLKEAAQQALEVLGSARSVFNGEGDTIGGCGWCHAPSCGPCEPHCEKDRAVKALRAALAEDAMQRLTDVQQEMDCYGDGNVYRGQRSKDSKTQTLTFSKMETVEPVAWITPGQDLHLVNYEGFQDWVPLYTAPPKREPLLIEGNEFIGDPPAPAKTWGEYFENVVTTSRLSGLRVSALANPVAHGIGGGE